MIPATQPVQRPHGAKLLVMNQAGVIQHIQRSRFADLLCPGDLVVANDAATLPASLAGVHTPTGRRIEARLAGSASLAVEEDSRFLAVIFGEGDFRMRTEDRPSPPRLRLGDRLELGPLIGTVAEITKHPRLISLQFEGSQDQIWQGLSRHGRPIQYSHVASPLALWDTWTAIAGPPVAFEPPSAGFLLSWELLSSLPARGVQFATITHAAGISSTGDPQLDELLPFDEPYRIPAFTARALRRVREQGGRVIAIGTTVVRALEHAASFDGLVRVGEGLATRRIGPASPLRVVDAILSGTHEKGSSHYELLRAFIGDEDLGRIDEELNTRGYTTHEFGDSIFVERRLATSQRNIPLPLAVSSAI